MSDSFDPYHIWLGIPPKDQPPNHYRLLGLQDLEENPDVIDAAANRQTTYLHEMAAGPNRQESQELLNEIAAARRCLLNPEAKQAYDEKLKADQAATAAPPTAAVPVAVPVAQAVAPPTVPVTAPAPEAAPASEVPNFDFSVGEPAPEPSVNINTAQSKAVESTNFSPQSLTAQPDDQPVAVTPGVASGTPSPAVKKTGSGKWIIAGCSIAAVTVAAFAFSKRTQESKKQPEQTTAEAIENGTVSTPASEVAAASPEEKPAGANEEAPEKKSKPSMFDQVDEAESIFSLPSNFGTKDKKKK